MKCRRCGIDLTGGRGAYHWRSELAAIGEDFIRPIEAAEGWEEYRERLFDELASMSSEEINNDVYQLWEGELCRLCRVEFGNLLDRFLRIN